MGRKTVAALTGNSPTVRGGAGPEDSKVDAGDSLDRVPGMEGNVVTILLNGTRRDVGSGLTVFGLLRELELAEVPVLVEWNGTALFPREFDTTHLTDGGVMEIIRIVAGG